MLTPFNTESTRSQDTQLLRTRSAGTSRDRIELPRNAIRVIEANVLAMGPGIFFNPFVAYPCRFYYPLHPDAPNMMDWFAQYFGGDAGSTSQEASQIPAYPDTSIADYVWLPVWFDGEIAYLDWKDEWRVEDYEDER